MEKNKLERSSMGYKSMITGMLGGLLLTGMMACTAQTQVPLNNPAGQLFCSIQKGLTPFVAPIIQATAGASDPVLGAVAVLVTNQTAAWVQAQCDAAAVAVGGSAGIPVAPPAPGVALAPVAIPAKVGA